MAHLKDHQRLRVEVAVRQYGMDLFNLIRHKAAILSTPTYYLTHARELGEGTDIAATLIPHFDPAWRPRAY